MAVIGALVTTVVGATPVPEPGIGDALLPDELQPAASPARTAITSSVVPDRRSKVMVPIPVIFGPECEVMRGDL